MAYYQQYTFSTYNQLLIDLSAFLTANGWTVDLDGVYNTSYRRVHFHKGSAHFDIYSGASNITAYGCTGYSSGSAPNAQPGVSGSRTYANGTVGQPYWFVSVIGAVYLGIFSASAVNWGVFYHSIPVKIGSWADGFGLQGTGQNTLFGSSAYASTANAQIYINGAWSAFQAAINGISGGNYSNDFGSGKSLNIYNGGLTPLPILVFIGNSADGTKKHPIGYAPGLYKANGGDVYDIGEIIVISGYNYIIIPSAQVNIGSATNGDFIFKLGA